MYGARSHIFHELLSLHVEQQLFDEVVLPAMRVAVPVGRIVWQPECLRDFAG